MKDLSIIITSPQEEIIWGLHSYWGKLIINDFEETIYVPVEFWSLDIYQNQWKEGLDRLKKKSKSCLVATIQGYENIPTLINWWILYKQKNKIFIQNQLLIETSLKETIKEQPFTPETCYNYIPRKSRSKKVAEWIVELMDS